MLRRAIVVTCLALGCGSEGSTPPPDGGTGGPSCELVVCPPGQSCVSGTCVRSDECANVECPEQGTVCSHGACVGENVDEDGDGSPALRDCDDRDPEILAGTTRPCATRCGSGTSTCEDAEWQPCTAPTDCTCAPGDTREDPCGRCGRAVSTCAPEGIWGPPGACEGEGECLAHTVGVRDCQRAVSCQVQERSCDDACRWGRWGDCVGPDECTPGLTSSLPCGTCGTQTRTCTPGCAWGAFGACEGDVNCCDPEACSAFGAVCCPGTSECVATLLDESNCGNCGTVCAASQFCVFDEGSGTVGCAFCDPDACGAFGASCCPGVNDCVVQFQDEANCGGCGIACPAGQTCVLEPGTENVGCANCDPDGCAAFGVHCCPGVEGCVDGPC